MIFHQNHRESLSQIQGSSMIIRSKVNVHYIFHNLPGTELREFTLDTKTSGKIDCCLLFFFFCFASLQISFKAGKGLFDNTCNQREIRFGRWKVKHRNEKGKCQKNKETRIKIIQRKKSTIRFERWKVKEKNWQMEMHM